MNLLDRLRARARQEGMSKTIQYIGLAGYDCIRSMARDAVIDFKYCGNVLDNCKTLYKHLGANDVYHSDYDALSIIFNFCCPVAETDVLVDVGCGKGRVINYWLSQGLRNRMIGLELDPDIANQTAKQFERRPNVSILAGDAIANIPLEGSLFYFYNPFSRERVALFEEKLRKLAAAKTVKVIYYNPKSIDAFSPAMWHIEHINFDQDLGIKRWGRISKYHDLSLIQSK